MAANRVIFRAAGWVAVLAVGAFLGAQFRAASESGVTTPRVASGGGADGVVALRAELARLRAELAQRSAPTPDLLANGTGPAALSPVDQLRVLADLSKRRLMTPRISTFNYRDSGVLSASFVELFALNAPEQAALQAAVNRARERVASLELENAAVERAANGDVAIKIRPFPQVGGAIYDEMIKVFAETLGPDRQSAFLVLAASDVEKSLGWFGTAERTLTFSQVTTSGGDTQFKVQVQHKLPSESGSQGSSFKTFGEMAAWVGTPTQLLPKDFGSKK